MSVSKIQHSKFKNTGILFELLVRQVTADTLEGKNSSKAAEIIREFFKPSTELGKELILYRALFTEKNLTEGRALKFIDMILEQRKKLNSTRLSEQKYQLVKRIKSTYPIKEFFETSIPLYRVYASIYKTFLAEISGNIDISEITEVAQSRFTLVEYLMGTKKDITDNKTNHLIETLKAQDESLRLLTFKILIERFNQKYKNLNDSQKKLLREYINNAANTNSLKNYILIEVPKVQTELANRIRVVNNRVMQIKLHEVISQLTALEKSKTIRDNQVSALMIAYEIIKEIKNNED